MYPFLMLSLGCIALAPTDWPEILQKPYAKFPIPDLGLQPLLVTRSGKRITTKEDWTRARKALDEAWLEQLGKPPVKPDRLDVRIEETKKLEGYSRQLLSFSSEGDDRIRAYLLTPSELKPNEKRPVVVVFHSTTKETLKEPTDLGKDPERAYALHLVRRGYITLCPECYILKDP